jgi:hypothetical protein
MRMASQTQREQLERLYHAAHGARNTFLSPFLKVRARALSNAAPYLTSPLPAHQQLRPRLARINCPPFPPTHPAPPHLPPSTCSPTHCVQVFGRGASDEAQNKPTPARHLRHAGARTIHEAGRQSFQYTTHARTYTPLRNHAHWLHRQLKH